MALEALRQTEALSVAAILIHLSESADRMDGEGVAFDPALDIGTVEAMKGEWLRLIRIRAADGTLIAESDLISLLFRWRDYAGSLDEPRGWVVETIRTDEGFANPAPAPTRLPALSLFHSLPGLACCRPPRARSPDVPGRSPKRRRRNCQ